MTKGEKSLMQINSKLIGAAWARKPYVYSQIQNHACMRREHRPYLKERETPVW